MLDQDKDFDQDGSRLVRIVENEVGYKNLRWAVCDRHPATTHEDRSGRGFGHDRGSDRFLPIGDPPKAFADSAPALLPGHLVVAAGRVEAGASERWTTR